MAKKIEGQRVKMSFTIEQLERMKTHELADLLANVVMVLRRMPDVECRELGSSFSGAEEERKRLEEEAVVIQPLVKVKFSAAELEGKKVAEIREIAKGLFLTVSSKSTKKELVGKILVRQEQEYSDQFAIQNV